MNQDEANKDNQTMSGTIAIAEKYVDETWLVSVFVPSRKMTEIGSMAKGATFTIQAT